MNNDEDGDGVVAAPTNVLHFRQRVEKYRRLAKTIFNIDGYRLKTIFIEYLKSKCFLNIRHII